MQRYEILLARYQSELPGFRVVRKCDSRFGRLLSWVTNLFGDTSQFCTTINRTVYVPDNWGDWSDVAKYRLLVHEMVHARQAKRYTFPLFTLLYLLCFPVILTFRAKFEREAYRATIMAYVATDGVPQGLDVWLAHTFSSGQYAWMWTYDAALRWARETIELAKSRHIELPAQDRVDVG